MLALLAHLALAGPRPVPAHVEHWRTQIDWDEAGDEAVDVLSEYLAVDSVNPPGNEWRAALYLGAVLSEEGIPFEIIEHATGRESLVARLEGTGDAPPLCLMSHTDIVPAEPEHWTAAPLQGTVRDGFVWGRGALDMKGMGAVELLTLVWLHRLRVPLDRNVVLLAVADEEVGNLGMRDLVEQHWDRLGCGHLINEGGLGIRDALFEGQTLHAISVAEKGLLWVRLVAEGVAGHGSTPQPGEAASRLLRAMERVERKYRSRRWIDPATRELVRNAGAHRGGVVRAVTASRMLTDLLVKPRFMAVPAGAAAITDTAHLTGMGGALQPNVVGSVAWAQYDCRLLPGTTPDEQLAKLERITRRIEGVRWEVLDSAASNRSPVDDPLYEAIAAYAVEDRPHAVAGPVLTVGFTDSLLARPLGTHAYGYAPFEVSVEVAESQHGHDERLDVDQVGEGLRRLFSIVVDVAGTPR